jgi:hypothetical protein
MNSDPNIEPYRGYGLQAIYLPPSWQVNIVRTLLSQRLPPLGWPTIEARTKEMAMSLARTRVDIFISG